MSFRDVFQTEWIEKIRGDDVVFPLLLIDDYVPWTTELHDIRKKSDIKIIALEKDVQQRIRLQRAADTDIPDLNYIKYLIGTVPASRRVLSMSLCKAGKSQQEADEIISKVRPGRLVELAATVSALFDIARDLPEPEKPDPNGQSPQGADSSETGNSSG